MRDLRRLLLTTLAVLALAFGATRWVEANDAPEPGAAHLTPSSAGTRRIVGRDVTLPAPDRSSAPTAARPTGMPAGNPSTTVTTSASPTSARDALRGAVIVIDPGHNGGNAAHPDEIGRLVDIGTGMKPCNTTGAETADGYAEWDFNFDVAMRVARGLRAAGATVVLTHATTDGWGPCSVERAAIANRARADAAVSIHADGGPPDGRGFHVLEPALLPGLTDDIAEPSHRLAVAVRDAVLRATEMPVSDYLGSEGLLERSDLGGLNRADVPAIFLESGNMRNATDAALLSSSRFRDSLAAAIVDGLAAFLAAG